MGRNNRQRIISFIAILVAVFLGVACVSALMIATNERDRGIRADRERITQVSAQFAQRLDPQDLASLKSTKDAESPAFARLRSQIERFRAEVPDVAECYTIRYSESGAQVLVDSGRRIGASRSAISLRYNLLDPLDAILSPAIIAAMVGTIQHDDEPSHEVGADFRRVYIPIKDSKRNVVSVLVVSTADRPLSYYLTSVVTRTAPGWIVAFLFVLITTGIVARALDDLARKETTLSSRGGSKVLRWILTDATLVLLALIAVGGLRVAYSIQRQTLSTLVASEARTSTLTEHAAMIRSDDAVSLRTISASLKSEAETQADMRSQLEQSELAILSGFIFVGLLALGTLVALRSSIRAHLSLRVAREEADWHRTQHEQIISGLPIGFYAAENAEIVFSNRSMDMLLDRSPNESAQEAFQRSLQAEDTDKITDVLKGAEQSGFAFSHTLRLGEDPSTQRFLETHGVPFADEDGSHCRVVGFAMDVTDRVRAQMLAERRQREFEGANELLRTALEAGELNFEATVHALVKAVEAKDVYTAGHSERVMHYSVQIGLAMGLNETQLRTLRMGTLIHDVGKIGIPDAILSKPDRLTQEEFALIKQHPEIGVRMIEGIPAFADCIPIVLYHHERLDGRGYPFGLTEESIPLLARIAAIADCYDAMTSDRAYRKGRSPMQALGELAADAERGALDGKIVGIFADIVLNGMAPEVRHAA